MCIRDSRYSDNWFDLSSIAKGYAVQKIHDYLESNNLINHLIDIGGEIIISGSKHGDPWNIGIQNPLSDINNSAITINNSDHNFLAIATSGEYRNFKFDKDGNKNNFECDVVLISVGRKPNTEGLNLKNAGVSLDEKNRIKTDKKFKTNVENIYAIGDVIVGPMLAHKAEDEGIAVAENIVGQSGHVNYDTIPGVVYTSPEVASIGKTEEQLKELNKSYKVGKFSFMANSRAKAIDDAEGFVKILADAETDKVLGAHIIGPHAGELIAEIGVAMEFGASAEDIARTCHAHPTFSEAVKEAALSVDKRAIHS